MKKIKSWLLAHKIVNTASFLAIGMGFYFGVSALSQNGNGDAEYVAQAVERGTIISSVSGAGQVSASNQVDLKSSVSEEVTAVNIAVGQKVQEGDVLVRLDTTDASKAVRDAQNSLESAELALEELLQGTDSYTLIQAENSLADAKDDLEQLKLDQETSYQNSLDSKEEAERDLEKAYEDAFSDVANAFLELPTIIAGLDDILYGYEISESESTAVQNSVNTSALINSIKVVDDKYRYSLTYLIDDATEDYQSARLLYSDSFGFYKSTSRYSDEETIEALLEQTITTIKDMAEATKSQANFIDYWRDYRTQRNLSIFSQVSDFWSDLNSYTSKLNSQLSSLLSAQSSIEKNKDTIEDAEQDILRTQQTNPMNLAAAERKVQEKEENLAKLKAGAEDSEIKEKQLNVQQKLDALISTQEDLADHSIKAPFDGVVAEVGVTVGDNLSSSTAVASLITEQKIAEITLNEVDVARVEVGQKAVLQFDAVEELEISGQVVEVDALGEVTQGVVSYGVKIAFDVQDQRIKPGMTVSASIITDVKQDVLVVPSSAIGSQNNGSFVQILQEDGTVVSQVVELGISSDTQTEIVSGLQEGQQIVTQTVTASSISSGSSQEASGGGFQGPPDGGGGVGGMMRGL